MESEFWLTKWRNNEIGFHEPMPHRLLITHWDGLGLVEGESVLVPLCGKSLDLMWLRERGLRVTGVELSALAVESFFEEQELAPTRDRWGPFQRYRVDGLEILQGDFFSLRPGMLPGFSACYDRAALIALPQAQRPGYAAHVAALLDARARTLLVTLEYEPPLERGPPFSVSAQEVRELFAEHFEIEALARVDVLAENPRLQARGLGALWECAYALKARAADTA